MLVAAKGMSRIMNLRKSMSMRTHEVYLRCILSLLNVVGFGLVSFGLLFVPDFVCLVLVGSSSLSSSLSCLWCYARSVMKGNV